MKTYHLEPFNHEGCCCSASVRSIAMLFLRNMWLTIAVALTSLSSLGARPIHAEQELTDLSTQEAIKLYNIVKEWVTSSSINPQKAIFLHLDPSAIKITLRWHGATMAEAQANMDELIGDMDNDDQEKNHTLKLSQDAFKKALMQSKNSLRAAYYHAASSPQRKTASPVELEEVAPRFQVDLQIALEAEPIQLPKHKPQQAIYQTFIPGLHALRMTSTARPTLAQAWVWPASALAANSSQWSQLIQLITQVGHEVVDLPSIGQAGGPRLERFKTIHITQTTPDGNPKHLVRGSFPIPVRSLDEKQLESMAANLASFLITRQRDDGTMAGTYFPSLDRYDPATCPPHDLALAAYALTRRAKYLQQTAHNPPQVLPLIQAADRALHHLLTDQHIKNQTQSSYPLTSLILLCLTDTPTTAASEYQEQRDALTRRLVQGSTLFDPSVKPLPDKPSATMGGLIALALTAVYERTRAPDLLKVIAALQHELWQDVTPVTMIKRLPWHVLAETRLRHVLSNTGHKGDSNNGFTAHTEVTNQMLDVLIRHQLTTPPEDGLTDVVGGFDFRTSDGVARPDWNSARALYVIAATLGNDQMIAERDKVGMILSAGLTARFLNQLMFDEPGCYYVRSMSDVIGGVRISPIDNRVAVGPTATTLLAITELQQSLRHLKSKPNALHSNFPGLVTTDADE